MKDKIVVTRHTALVEYMIEMRMIDRSTPVIAHATADDIRGKRVYGVLPNHLAALADSITEIPLDLPHELRGKELTLEQVREYAGMPVTYHVRVAGPYDHLSPGDPVMVWGPDTTHDWAHMRIFVGIDEKGRALARARHDDQAYPWENCWDASEYADRYLCAP